jgi:hypothetical protein
MPWLIAHVPRSAVALLSSIGMGVAVINQCTYSIAVINQCTYINRYGSSSDESVYLQYSSD